MYSCFGALFSFLSFLLLLSSSSGYRMTLDVNSLEKAIHNTQIPVISLYQVCCVHLCRPYSLCGCNAGHCAAQILCPVYVHTFQLDSHTCATFSGGGIFVAGKSPLCSIVCCSKDTGTVLCCPCCFPSDRPRSVPIFWSQFSTVFVQEILGRTRAK